MVLQKGMIQEQTLRRFSEILRLTQRGKTGRGHFPCRGETVRVRLPKRGDKSNSKSK
jgi:hypothetical protein